jgi:hypothetical protein
MNIKKTLKSAVLMTVLLAPLSSFALFDWGYRDDYYYDRPHLFGGYRRGYYGDRYRYDAAERDAQLRDKEVQLREKELELREREAQMRDGQMPAEKQKPAPRKPAPRK